MSERARRAVRRGSRTRRPSAGLSRPVAAIISSCALASGSRSTNPAHCRRAHNRPIAPGRCYDCSSAAGWSSLVARRAHNPKVAGSNPAPATKEKVRIGVLFVKFTILSGGVPRWSTKQGSKTTDSYLRPERRHCRLHHQLGPVQPVRASPWTPDDGDLQRIRASAMQLPRDLDRPSTVFDLMLPPSNAGRVLPRRWRGSGLRARRAAMAVPASRCRR